MKRLLFFINSLILSALVSAQAPTPDFSANVREGCSPLVVEFSDQSTGGATSWYWDFGNGATSTLKNPSTSYFNPGTYTITLKATNAAGSNTISKSAFITVYNQPVVDFVASKISGCTPITVQFTDQSVSAPGTTITEWKWSFGDGSNSDLQNPNYTYKSDGSFTVTLTIKTDKGCTKSLTKPYYINPTPGVKPGFNYTDPDVCSAPATVSFTNNSTGPGTLSYTWDFANGSTSNQKDPSAYYATNGNYRVLLTVTSDQGCMDTVSTVVTVGKATTDFIVPANICPGQPVQFINNSTPRPITANWQFSNVTTDTLKNGVTTFQTAGTYTVTLINSYSSCTDTLTKTVSTSPPPQLQFQVSDTAKCQAPLTVNFTNNSNAASYVWDFGDSTATSTQTNPSHTYNKTGTFTVTLIGTGANGCTDTLRKTALIKIRKPVIRFANLPANGCIPYKVDFAANIQSVDSVTSYSWDFGVAGATSNLKNPSYTYNTQGTYNVTLTITTSTGCTETYKLDEAVMVGTKPTAAFTSTSTTGCANPGIQFTNQSVNATKYEWYFSDGSRSILKDPLQTFSDTGWIDVTLIANNNGCEDRVTKEKFVYIQPSVSKFDYRPDCNNPLQITFTDRSIGANTWFWEFGDGTTFTGQTPPTHTYPTNGTYSVSLTTTNGSCTYKLTKPVAIIDNTPDFTASSVSGCGKVVAYFTASTPNDGLIKTYTWDFGDGNFGTLDQKAAANTYNGAGKYTVKLTTLDSFGCTHERIKTDYIIVEGPIARFTSTTNRGCKGLETTFIDSSITDPSNPVVSWKFVFGDGTSQTFTAPPFTHVYDSVGDYDVKMIVTDSKGCSDSVLVREFVKISTLKAAWLNNSMTCPGSFLKFFDKSSSDLPLTYVWNFGDNDTSSLQSPTHAYADTGYYDVKLKIRDIVGCEDSLTKTAAVYVSRPKASFTANNLVSYCTPFEARFKNTSWFIESSLWDLGNATTVARDPVNYYTSTGTYQIKLVVTSEGGCKDSTFDYLEIYNPSDGVLSYDTLQGCRPQTVNFTSFKPMNGRFIWDFGDGNVIDTSSNSISHVYENFGKFIPKVILKQPEGCVIPLTGKDTIVIYGAKVLFGIDKFLFCDTGTVQMLDSTTYEGSAPQYTWDFGDGQTSSQKSPSHKYITPGNYNILLTVVSAGGCIDSMRLMQPVRVSASPDISVAGDAIICANERLDLSGVINLPDSSGVTWLWQFPNGVSYNVKDPPPQQYPPGNYTVYTRATNTSGCLDSVTTQITVYGLPAVTLPPTITKRVGVPVTLPAEYSSGVQNYWWSPANDLSCTNCPTPQTTTKFARDYVVSVADGNGCFDSASIRVIVLCEGATIFFPNAFSPNGDGSNDVFYPRGYGLDRVKSVRLFNRWGEVVYEQKDFPVNNAAYGWNGKYKGHAPQPGVYVYQAEIFCENGEVIRVEGNVALIQ